MRVVRAAAVAVVVLAAGCSDRGKSADQRPTAQPSRVAPAESAAATGSASNRPSAAAAPTTPGAAATSAGGAAADAAATGAAAACDPGLPHAPGRTVATVAVKGAPERRYVLFLPESYDGSRRVPLVFNFHGYGATADQQLFYSNFLSVAERNDFAVVALNGQGDRPHYNQRPVTHRGEVSDVAVVKQLLATLSKTICLDDRRIYATGMSDGGVLAAALACFAPERFAAVAPVAGLVYDRTCVKGKPVPLMAFRGTADEIVPYDGGTVSCCGRPKVNSTKADIAAWARHNRCAGEPAVIRKGDVETSTYSSCAGGSEVVLHSIIGGGHTWPGAIGLPGLGQTTRDINASSAMWEFFASHPKR